MSHWRQTQEPFSGEGDKCSWGSVASVSRHPPPIPTPSLRSPGPARPAALSYVSNSENLRICQSKVFQRLRTGLGLFKRKAFLHRCGACQVSHGSLQHKTFSFCLLHRWPCHGCGLCGLGLLRMGGKREGWWILQRSLGWAGGGPRAE